MPCLCLQQSMDESLEDEATDRTASDTGDASLVTDKGEQNCQKCSSGVRYWKLLTGALAEAIIFTTTGALKKKC